MKVRFRLRTLLLLLAVLPTLLGIGWVKYTAFQAEREQARAQEELRRQNEVIQSRRALATLLARINAESQARAQKLEREIQELVRLQQQQRSGGDREKLEELVRDG